MTATGTDGDSGCSLVARTPGNHGHPKASRDTKETVNGEGAAVTQPRRISSLGIAGLPPASVKAVGLEPTTYGLKVCFGGYNRLLPAPADPGKLSVFRGFSLFGFPVGRPP